MIPSDGFTKAVDFQRDIFCVGKNYHAHASEFDRFEITKDRSPTHFTRHREFTSVGRTITLQLDQDLQEPAQRCLAIGRKLHGRSLNEARKEPRSVPAERKPPTSPYDTANEFENEFVEKRPLGEPAR